VSNETIFDQGTPPDQGATDNQQPEVTIPTEVADFVGDGKKYSSVEDALKSVPHAQKHIQTLESELAQLKEEVAKRRTAEELLDEIKSGIRTSEITPQPVGLDKNELAQVVNQTIEMREAQRTAKQNADSVVAKFKDKFGDTAEQAYVTLAKESGLSVQQLNNLAATSPSAVLRLAGLVNGEPAVAAKTTSSVNTEAFSGNKQTEQRSARVKQGATTKDLVEAWRAAGEKVKANLTT
jgi:hypothetical protein